ncbi:uncharacterized protein LOC110861921 [Folsomia candida]|nr:uncharacterized protein LOC110861921 [Folsomia candida]
MGAAQTTFCNEAAVPISTGVSVAFTYFLTETLLPGKCVTSDVGPVWFTAFAHIPSRYKPGLLRNQVYFLTNDTTAVGMEFNSFPFHLPQRPVLKYWHVSRDEADYIMAESDGYVEDNLSIVRSAISVAVRSMHTESSGFYAGRYYKIRVTGGPKRIISSSDLSFGQAHILPFKEEYDPFRMHIKDRL